MTGHARGVITLNIAEADDPERERQRKSMREPYPRCSAISATRLRITTGTGCFRGHRYSINSANCSGTSGRTIRPLWSATMPMDRRQTGPHNT